MNRRILSLLIFRAALFSIITLLQLLGPLVEVAGFPFRLFVLLSLLALSINWVGFLMIKSQVLEGSNQKAFIWVQILVDIFLVSVFVYYFKDEFVAAPVFYVFIITMSTLFFNRVYVYLIAILSFVSYFTLSVPGNPGELPFQLWIGGTDLQTLKVSGGYFVVFFTVALLGNYLRSIFETNYATIQAQKKEIQKLEYIRKNIVESLNSGLITLDGDERVTYANPAAYNLLEKEDSINGLFFSELFSFEDPQTEGIRRHRVECQMLVGGRKKTFGLAISEADWGAVPLGKLILFQDLTRIKQLEDQQLISSKMAAIGKVAAGVAHEIRNPLAAMSGSVQVIASMLPENNTIDELMGIVQKETARLNHIIDQFLSYSRPLSAEGFKPLNLHEVIGTFLRLARNDSLVRCFRLGYDYDQKDVLILGHSEQMIQVLWNLLRNSCQASEEGTLIQISLSSGDQEACLSVKDQGEGLSAQAKKHLFTPFQRFRKGPGLGLGLSIVYEIVQLHGGSIQVSSEQGIGTTFNLRFPLHSEEE